MNIEELLQKQRTFYRTRKTVDVKYRKAALKKLRTVIMKREKDIAQALYLDLRKSSMEAYMSEIGLVLSELTYQMRHLEEWSAPQKVKTPLAHFPSTSFISPQPYGVVLIMSPWNYPFQLAMEPAIGAIAAGNTVIIKPSAYAAHTSAIIAEIIQECFKEDYVAVVEGGRLENAALLEQRFDYIFFTGGVEVGRLVMEKASRYLTPISLELGGKSPCIVDRSANLKLAAKRIIFGKFLNAGQTCVAPDYVFVEESVRHDLLAYMQYYIHKFFGEDPLQCEDYPCIINEKHYQRLMNLMKDTSICIGGRSITSKRLIEPTILEQVRFDDPIMQEEIFGPLLPVIGFHDIKEAFGYINDHEKPLALYLFTRRRAVMQKALKELSFGGGCINDTIIHLATSEMGFGGVGMSGMGSYHGYESFKTFSHFRSIVKKSNKIDLPIRYQPYTKWKAKLTRLFLH